MRFLQILMLGVFLAIAPQMSAQEESKFVRIVTLSGNMIEGEILDSDENSFLLEVPVMGKMRIQKLEISSIIFIDKENMGINSYTQNQRSGEINPRSDRYLFAPSSHNLEKGEGYFHNVMVLYNQLSYGLTDNITTGLSMTPFGAGGTIKIGKKLSDNFGMSVGSIAVTTFNSGDMGFKNAGIGFVNMTFGNERKNISFNYGLGFVNRDPYEWNPTFDNDDRAHMLNVGAMMEVNSSLWIVFEGYLISDTQTNFGSDFDNIVVLMPGVRKATSGRNVIWEWAMVSMPSEGAFVIPWVSVTIPF